MHIYHIKKKLPSVFLDTFKLVFQSPSGINSLKKFSLPRKLQGQGTARMRKASITGMQEIVQADNGKMKAKHTTQPWKKARADILLPPLSARPWHYEPLIRNVGMSLFSWSPLAFWVFFKCLKAEIFQTQVASPSRRYILNLWGNFSIFTIIQKTSLALDRQHIGQSCTTKKCPESHNVCPARLLNSPLDIHVGKKVSW